MAVFSNRVSTRRHSLSHPTNRSTMLRRRYAARSKSGCCTSFARCPFSGITGLIPRCWRSATIRSARYALSPASFSGNCCPVAPPHSARPHDPRHFLSQHGRFVILAGGRHFGVQGEAAAVAEDVDFRAGKSPATAAQRPHGPAVRGDPRFFRPPRHSGPARTIVPGRWPHNSLSISSASARPELRAVEDFIEQAAGRPAIEVSIHRFPRAEFLRQIAPRSAGAAFTSTGKWRP